MHGTEAIHFGNVSYLGLETDERLKQAAIEAINRYGIQFSSSRAYLQLPLYEELEALLEQMYGRPVVVTASTTLGHLAAMPAFIHPEDAVLVDYQAHASIQLVLQTVKALGTHVELVLHNDFNILEERVKALSEKHSRVWYMADGVYSMFGNVVPAVQLNYLMERYEKLHAYLDDAHGISWTGTHGTGYVHDLFPKMHDRILLVGSMAKGFASTGGFIVCPDEATKTMLRRAGSTLVFSGPLHASSLAAAIESAKIHLSDEIKVRQQKVKSNIRYFLESAERHNVFLADRSETPIFFIGVGKMISAAKVCRNLREAGCYTNLGVYPAVGLNQTGVRISIHHAIEKNEIDYLLRLTSEFLAEELAETGTTRVHLEQAYSKRKVRAQRYQRDDTADKKEKERILKYPSLAG